MAIVLTQLKINDVDVSIDLTRWKTEEVFGQEISTCEIELNKNIWNTLPSLQAGNSITIKRGTSTATDQFIFEGYVDQIIKDRGFVVVKGKDKLIDLMARQVTYSYDQNVDASAGSGSEIASDLIETHGEMTATVVATPATILVSKLICNHVSVFDKVKEIADIYDYSLFYDPDDSTVHFEPKGTVEHATVLEAGVNTLNLPKWTYDFSQCINKITVLGAEQIVEDTELFSGDGTGDQTNTLANKPISVVASVSGTVKTPGVSGVTTGSYDYEIDKERKLISWNQDYDPSGANVVSVSYTRAIPIAPAFDRDSSVTKYGLREASRHFSNIQTLADTENAGNSFLDKFAEPFVTTMVKVSGTYDIDAGNLVRVKDIQHNEDRWLMVHRVVRKYPHNGDEIHLGDKEWRISDWGKMTMDRIKRLEELTAANTDLIVHVKNLVPTSLKIRRRYLRANVKTISGSNVFILGNISYGILGTSKLGGADSGAETFSRLVWQNQRVREPFQDVTFKDTNATTCVWSGGGANFATFADGEIAQSDLVYDNNATLTAATLSATEGSGAFTYEISANSGSNWDTVNSTVRKSFTTSGSQLIWRATASGASQLNLITIDVEEI